MKFSSMTYAALGLTLAGSLPALGCGGTEEEQVTDCPSMAPLPMNQMGPCCYRSSNAMRLHTPAFRVASLKLIAPSGTLSTSVVSAFLQESLDTEGQNWLIQVNAAGPGAPTVRVGGASRHPDGTFSFDVPNSTRGTPDGLMTAGTLEGEDLRSLPLPGVLDITGTNSTYGTSIDMPIYLLTILHMPMTENRSCVGLRTTRWNTAAGGVLSGFVRVADAKASNHLFPASTPILDNATLCDVIAGDLSRETKCDTTPQEMWTTPPDSLCTGTACTENTTDMVICDPAVPEGSTGVGGRPGCNAWKLVAEFDAQGVEIV